MRSICRCHLLLLLASCGGRPVWADSLGPTVTSGRINPTGARGTSPDPTINNAISSIPADVQEVWYDANSAYIKSTDIPSYSIGPFPGDPNVPGQVPFLFRIPRAPQVQSGPKTAT